MIKKTITYTDLLGETVTEDHYFNLSKADVMDLEMSREGGYSEWFKSVLARGDNVQIYEEFKNLVLRSFGTKSEDGRHFIKSNDQTHEFKQTEAYGELLVELCTDTDKAAEFFSGITPDFDNANPAQESLPVTDPTGLSQPTPPSTTITSPVPPPAGLQTPAPVTLTRDQAMAMDSNELQSLLTQGATIVDSPGVG